MELVPTVISTGWASGVNAYGTVLFLGLLGRAGFGTEAVPDALTSDSVLIGAGVMYAIEFVTDKIPFLDNTWDLLHTLIRPAIGSAIGVEFADLDKVTGTEEVLAGGAAGTTALTSHAIKAGLRLGINASPEPFSNIFVSLAEDATVAGVIALTLNEPLIALAIVLVLIGIGIGLILLLRKAIRKGLEKRREQKGSLVEEEPPDEPRGPPPDDSPRDPPPRDPPA